MSDKPFWTQVTKYYKNTTKIAKTYPKVRYSSAKKAIFKIKELHNVIYVDYPAAYEHDTYDWVVECDKWTQMFLDLTENL